MFLHESFSVYFVKNIYYKPHCAPTSREHMVSCIMSKLRVENTTISNNTNLLDDILNSYGLSQRARGYGKQNN